MTETSKFSQLAKRHGLLVFIWLLIFIFGVCAVWGHIHLMSRIHQQQIDQLAYHDSKMSLHESRQSLQERYILLSQFSATLQSKFIQAYLAKGPLSIHLKFKRYGKLVASDQALLEEMLALQNAVDQKERHILKLVLEGYGVPKEVIPARIAGYQLAQSEMFLTSQDQLSLAHEMIYSEEIFELYHGLISLIDEHEKGMSQVFTIQKSSYERDIAIYHALVLSLIIAMILMLLIILWIRIAEVDRLEPSVQHKKEEPILPQFGDQG